jgi:TonB family protein
MISVRMKALAPSALVLGLMFGPGDRLPAPTFLAPVALIPPPPPPNAASPTNSTSAQAVPPSSRATIVKRVDPEYSDEARAAKLEGVVTVYYEVDPDGSPRAVRVIRGLGMGLDEKAVEAVEHWRFDPPPSTLMESVDVYFDLGTSRSWSLRHAAYTVITEDPAGTKSSRVERPVLSHYTPPSSAACPEGARSVVTAYLHIDKKGVPSDVRPGSTPAALAVGDAVRSWRFRPAQSNGGARAADGVFTLVCNLAPPAVTAPARVGGGVSPPSVISQANPDYSEAAMRAKQEGDVQLELTVDADGFATNIRVIRPLGLDLDERAIEALAQWRFNPAVSDGTPVPVVSMVQMVFRLR